jgi:hypothetical protein
MMLKHKPPAYTEYDASSPFVDAGKELCGSMDGGMCGDKALLLDACPRRLTKQRVESTLRVDRGAVFVVLVRHQADALLSLYRDVGSSGYQSVDADTYVRSNAGNAQYNFSAVLDDLAAWGVQTVVVVHSKELRAGPSARRAVNRIWEAVGMPRSDTSAIVLRANTPHEGSGRYRAGSISYSTGLFVEHVWHVSNLEFAVKTGVTV